MGDTGSIRDLEHTTWAVRLTVLLQLVHWKLRAADVWTIEPGPSAEDQLARMSARLSPSRESRFQA